MIEKKCWVVESIDAGDGSGDMIINLPPELLAQTGLGIGDELSIKIENGSIVLRPVARSSAFRPSAKPSRETLHKTYRSLLEAYLHISSEASGLAIHKAIESGFSAVTLKALCDVGILRPTDREWIVPSRVFRACLKDDVPFDADASDRFYRTVHIVAMATAVFDDSKKATRWLSKPQSYLDGKTPFELLQSTVGFHEVEEMLIRVSEGLYG
ncbi:DUF2384 domain-containing protein [Pseudomonas atacamensis]|uniref:antitoxin Xre/MbcA/ParS toxin-binding domain-containing protein n=1 Tax=Pseudomonas atacamensis TaxID=2565368 RepID=UPI001C3E02FC|nr:antitoxin Xre/MbcA/ParS toxin-binding domain-containing protein [Pseudomonas atacamensis]QXH74799.1 DUF2384 domain-containing protein [Pseudomonas atacamensis]